MTHLDKHIRKSAEEYALSNDERARMRRVVREYVTFKPLKRETPVVITYHWFAILKRPIAAALAAVFITSGGISYAAESALPGDVLYAVKTYVNEPTRVALATNAEAKAEVQIDLAERRIEEAAILAADGRLDDSTEAELAASFKSYAGAARENIEEADDSDSSSEVLAARFENRLVVHENILAEVEAETSTEDDREHRLTVAIRATSEILAAARTKRSGIATAAIEVDVATTLADVANEAMTMSMTAPAPVSETRTEKRTAPATDDADSEEPAFDAKKTARIKSAAEKALKAAEKSLRNAKSLTADARTRAESEIAVADDSFKNGKELLDKENAEAYTAFEQSLHASEQVSIFIKAAPTLEKARERGRNKRSNSDSGKREVRLEVVATTSATATLPVSEHREDDSEDDEAKDREDGPEKHSDSEGSSGFKILNKLNISL